MPEIQEYLPQVEASEPISGVGPNVELAGAVGRGIARAGAAVEQAGQFVHEKTAQAETADLYSSFADKRAQYIEQVQRQIQDGSLNTDKLQEQLDQDLGQVGDKISTAEGRNYYERQSARLKGHLMQMAAAGEATIAKNQAQASWENGINATTNAVEADPQSLKDSFESGIETVDALIQSGGLPEKMREKAIQDMGKKYSEAAIRGLAKTWGPEAARAAMNDGHFDQFLSSDEKYKMEQEVHHIGLSQETEKKRAEKAKDDEKAAVADAWMEQNYTAMAKGTLSMDKVYAAQKAGIIDREDAEKARRYINEGTKEEWPSNPRLTNQLYQKIVNGEINDFRDIMPHVKPGGLNMADSEKLRNAFDKTDEGQEKRIQMKSVFSAIDRTAKFRNQVTQQWDPLGEQKAAAAKTIFLRQYNALKKTDPDAAAALIDPGSPSYFGKPENLSQYQTPIEEQATLIHQERSDKALGLKPTGNNPNPKPTDPSVRKKGESIMENLKRNKDI